MSSTFTDVSKEIANDFLQSIVFVDDKAFLPDEKEKSHELDAPLISQIFAKSKKVCAVYRPIKEEDIKNLTELSKKADVTVLDWQILLEDMMSNEESDDQADADSDDPRGTYTQQMICDILSDPISGKDSLKLILVYTGETDLPGIAESISKHITHHGIQCSLDGCDIHTESSKILVIAKPSGENNEDKFKHNKQLKERVISYEKLPEFILNEFSKMTSGLVSNVALRSITSIRNNSAKILGFYNQQMDPAFLAHRAMLPLPEDAGELLTDSIINSFEAIIDYDHVEDSCSFKHIKGWMKENDFEEQQLSIANKKELKLANKELEKIQKDGFVSAIEAIWQRKQPGLSVNVTKISSLYRDLHNKGIENYYLPRGASYTDFNEKFSMLTHHKSNFTNPSYTPKLTMGAVIKGTKDNSYWICIQQKCDSVRIPDDENRRFLFLPLVVVDKDKKFNFLVERESDFTYLKINFHSHSLRTIKFKANKDGMVIARKYGKSPKYFFQPIHFKSSSSNKIDQNYMWIMDLQDAHAQRVANKYASVLSRVGLDEAEWLRRRSLMDLD